MTRFLLIRHADHDAVGRYIAGAREGLHLNEAGQRAVGALVAGLRSVQLAAVVASPLERTRETAEPIAADHRMTVETMQELVEFDFGAWTGAEFRALEQDPEWRRFNSLRSVTRVPSGELMLDVQRRAVSALLHLRSSHPSGTVAVVSHGDVIRAALQYFLGIPIDFVHRFEISPARISVVDMDPDVIRVLQVNGSSVPSAF